MATLDKIKEKISEIAAKPRNVSPSDIEWVVDQLSRNGFQTTDRAQGDHGRLFNVNGRRFGICTHNRGSKHIKICYVTQFIKKMVDLELI